MGFEFVMLFYLLFLDDQCHGEGHGRYFGSRFITFDVDFVAVLHAVSLHFIMT